MLMNCREWVQPSRLREIRRLLQDANVLRELQVAAPDLRAGAALVIAGMMAEGYTYVDDIKFIERGYEDFDEKLRGIGANIIKAECEKDIKLFEFSVS